jgi:dipeptidyl aminopeptidase/acylaminoacyl peptidase
LLSRNLRGLVQRDNLRPSWISDTRFWYEINTSDGPEYYAVEIQEDGQAAEKRPLFETQRLAGALERVLGDGIEVDPETPGISEIEVSDDFRMIDFFYEGDYWTLDTETYVVEQNREADISPEGVVMPDNSLSSPQGRYAAFILDHNLWVRDMETGEDIQLSEDGAQRFGYATDSQGWTRSDRPVLKWSDDGRHIATYQLDEREVGEMHLLRTAEPRAELESWPYALPGDEQVPMHHRVAFDVENREMVRFDSGPYHQRTSNCCGLRRGREWADNQFIDDNTKLAYVSTSRDYKEVTLKIADLETGEVREVYSERDEKFIETNLNSRGVPNWHVLYDEGVFIWFSRASNWGHLYLHDLETGERLNTITNEGEWNVSDILRIDEENRRVIFTAAGMNPDRDPYQEYVYSVGFDGGGLRLHTPDEGHHSVSLSPNGRFLIDTFSSFTQPPAHVLRDARGEELMMLEEADISELLSVGWNFPEPITVKARDGITDLYGLMFKPSDFDEAAKYPIIVSLYPGPQTGSVGSRAFSVARRGQAQALAELGFIVIQVDALGTPMRSREFHTAYYGDMSDNGLPDQRAAVEQLARRHDFIDLSRVGIYGHSGGGFATAAALFNHGDFFHVGVAGAGNMDNRGYTYYWGEKYQGPLEETAGGDTFTNQALQYQVDGLVGKLMISYGTTDSNVHPNMTLLVIDALIEHNKDFDLLVMPNRGHGYANESYALRRSWDYFTRHLLNMEPPKEYEFD